jgi:hypothetical protein
MTNIWAKAYEEVRSPFFEMEDPYVVSEEKKGEKEEKEKKGEKEDHKGKSSKRWWDDDGDGVGYEEGEVSGKFKKKVKKEEVELDEASPIYSRGGEQRRTQTPRQIGVKSAPHNIPKGGTTISDRDPQGKRLFTGDQDRGKGNKAARRAAALKNEDFKFWVDALVEEGYDLSEYTWDEMLDIYEAEGSYGQTPKATAAYGKLANKRRETPASEFSKRGEKTQKVKSAEKNFYRTLNPDAGNRGKKSSKPSPVGSARRGMTQSDRDYARGRDEYGHTGYDGEGGGGSKPKGKKLERQRKTGVSAENYNIHDISIDEAQYARNNPEKYEREQSKKSAPVRGEKTPMPPRGNKRREDFEKWYRANVKEERELHSKNDKNERVDVRKGLKNKIEINPKLKEEVEAWVSELVEEGYDLSEFTWDEVAEIYETVELDEADTTMIPPKGDAQTMKPDPLQAAKRRAAQAQVRKELSDLQVAKARATAKLSPTSE